MNTYRRLRTAVLGALVAAILGLTGTVVGAASPAEAATVSNDTANKIVTMTGSGYSAKLNYNLQARISSLVVNGHEVLDPSQGIYSAVKIGTAWTTTQALASQPTVTVLGSTVTVNITTSLASETWTFTVQDAQLVFELKRVYSAAVTVAEQGTPMMNYAENSFDAMHWRGDGGAWPLGGARLNAYQESWLSTCSQPGACANLNPSLRAAKEQVSYALLNRSTSTALEVLGTSPYASVDRGQATEIRRSTNNDLRFQTIVSSSGLLYSSGNTTKGYSSGEADGHVRRDNTPIYQAVGVTAGQQDKVTTTFRPIDYAAEYDLGVLNGVDEELVQQAIDYARWAIQDTKRGASTEASILKAEVPALEMQWIGQLLELFPSPGALAAFRGGLEDIKTDLQDPTTGEVRCCRPGLAVPWGHNYGDMGPGYVLGVLAYYNLTGDAGWLNSMADSVRLALKYENSPLVDAASGLVKNPTETVGQFGANDYWQISSGRFNAYASALYYEALRKWAAVEASGTVAPAATPVDYTARANLLKTSFNLTASGPSNPGFWSPATNTFLAGSGNPDALYLPVQAEVLKTDLADPGRNELILAAIEGQARAGQYDFHPQNVIDVRYFHTPPDPSVAPSGSQGATNSGQNGGWYGGPDGDFDSALPALNEPQRLQNYLTAFLQRSQHDGWYSNSAWDRLDWTTGVGYERWFPTHVMPVWALYRAAYGFQPEATQLVLKPDIAPGMVGSAVKYTWRGNPMTVTYVSQRKFTIAAPAMATNIVIRWGGQTSGTRHIQIDGGTVYTVPVTNGYVEALFNKLSAGTHTFDCTDCTLPPTGTTSGTSFVTSVAQNGTAVRNDTTQYVGFQLVVGSTDLSVKALGRYKLPGNSQMHLLKIVNAAGQTVATASVDMSGTPDGTGFVWAALPSTVTLTHGQTYYVYSLEAAGGDTFWDSGATIGHSVSAGSVPNAAYGRTLKPNSTTNHTYGPVSFKY